MARIKKIKHTAGGVEQQVRSESEFLNNSSVVLLLCIDDDLVTGEGDHVLIGMPGTLATHDGDSEGFPRATRELVKKFRPLIAQALKSLFPGTTLFFTTSHEGCGALGLQDVQGQAASEKVTIECQTDWEGMHYAGYINNEGGALTASINENKYEIEGVSIARPKTDHNHHARRIVFTIGGGISGTEVEQLKTGALSTIDVVRAMDDSIRSDSELTNAFVVSADWISGALEQGGTQDEIIAILRFITDVSESIMRRTLAHKNRSSLSETPTPQLEFVVYDANRVDSKIAQENKRVLMNALSQYPGYLPNTLLGYDEV